MTNEQKELIEKAERDYPAGTVFISAMNSNNKTESTGVFEFYEFQGTVSVLTDQTCVYHNGQWAEIVSKPEKEISHLLISENPQLLNHSMPHDPNTVLRMPEAAQPVDIESDPRYKELLDEESRLFGYEGYWLVPMNPFKDSDDNECIYIESHLIQFNAQRRYFEEKLQEKQEQVNIALKVGMETLEAQSKRTGTYTKEGFYYDHRGKVKHDFDLIEEVTE